MEIASLPKYSRELELQKLCQKQSIEGQLACMSCQSRSRILKIGEKKVALGNRTEASKEGGKKRKFEGRNSM